MKTYILDIPIENITLENAVKKLLAFLQGDKNNIVITPNPEIVMKAQKDKELADIIKQADLVVPDGIGLVLASYIMKPKLSQRVAGIDLMLSFFELAPAGTTVYILGAKDGVAKMAKEKIEAKYKNIAVIGFHSGYFDITQEKVIIQEIERLEPHVLLVGLGAPKQEKWMQKNKGFPVKISVGVGGAIDVMAGVVKRAPRAFVSLNLEWFYRLATDPKRIVRMGALPKFVFRVVTEKISKKRKE
ncbi:MAG: WecB/TagA/CpsF family glycosyltransferase [Defluviitaleaceae bacterium]|nr:WecB/TagA/CpsF family glycosyltransferase [Defluviitaleaceae bacterium]